jgi:2-polyprenyl-6-methoxyphenol hydroxylase-like FAD-dependent oxidoreductase
MRIETAQSVDVVIVGGGIGGSTLAANLAHAGLQVEVLEREVKFVDRVRGEWVAPWGVAEAKRLRIYDEFVAAGGHHLARGIYYDELLDPGDAEAAVMPLDDLHPDAPGPLFLEHVVMQNTALQYAIECGARVRRGIKNVMFEAGDAPSVSYTCDDVRHTRNCRLVVGADGRSSTVRRQIGLALKEEEIDHLMSGLLVEGATDWPIDVQSFGKADDVMYLIFPQGDGKIRLYVDYDLSDRGRYTGEKGARNMLRAFDADCLPGGRSISKATPIGPCKSYPSQSAALDRCSARGAVLIGDAAGYTDPIFGQGISMTLRDCRIVRDLLVNGEPWTDATFEPYNKERKERIRRVMCVTRFGTTLFARFDEQGLQTRERAMQRISEQPELGALFKATFSGPETVPDEVFTDDFYGRIFST